jgi:hypothetical protein
LTSSEILRWNWEGTECPGGFGRPGGSVLAWHSAFEQSAALPIWSDRVLGARTGRLSSPWTDAWCNVLRDFCHAASCILLAYWLTMPSELWRIRFGAG